jgi:hypothetical protein
VEEEEEEEKVEEEFYVLHPPWRVAKTGKVRW